MGLTYQEVTEILKVVDASGCDEVVLEIDGTRLVVRRSLAGASAANIATPAPAALTTAAACPSPAALPPPPSPPPAAAVPTATNGASAAPAPAAAGTIELRAPMVGTFFRRPSPQEAVFVEAGQRVNKGQPLCLIEVMKLFTTIEAPTAGTVDAILPEDGSLVEFDQLLFRLRPA